VVAVGFGSGPSRSRLNDSAFRLSLVPPWGFAYPSGEKVWAAKPTRSGRIRQCKADASWTLLAFFLFYCHLGVRVWRMLRRFKAILVLFDFQSTVS